jgi:hypothetical protein
VVDSVSFPTAGYVSVGPQPTENAQSLPLPAQSAQPAPSSHGAEDPSVVVDFSNGLSSSYVIEWRDPSTHEVLLQLPMRSALPQTPASAPASSGIGHHVDTAA